MNCFNLPTDEVSKAPSVEYEQSRDSTYWSSMTRTDSHPFDDKPVGKTGIGFGLSFTIPGKNGYRHSPFSECMGFPQGPLIARRWVRQQHYNILHLALALRAVTLGKAPHDFRFLGKTVPGVLLGSSRTGTPSQAVVVISEYEPLHFGADRAHLDGVSRRTRMIQRIVASQNHIRGT